MSIEGNKIEVSENIIKPSESTKLKNIDSIIGEQENSINLTKNDISKFAAKLGIEVTESFDTKHLVEKLYKLFQPYKKDLHEQLLSSGGTSEHDSSDIIITSGGTSEHDSNDIVIT